MTRLDIVNNVNNVNNVNIKYFNVSMLDNNGYYDC